MIKKMKIKTTNKNFLLLNKLNKKAGIRTRLFVYIMFFDFCVLK